MNSYVPQVGDRVRLVDWSDSDAITVLAIGKTRFLGEYPNGYEGSISLKLDWVKVEPPTTYPEGWINVYPIWIDATACVTRGEADSRAYLERIAVIHLAADGTVTLYPTTGGAS